MPAVATEPTMTEETCLVCGCENEPQVMICAECFAPMELAVQAVRQETTPKIISVFGDSNVGQTVYLGMLLDILSKHPDNLTAVARGVYSVNLQESLVMHMANRRFPPKTPSEPDYWDWVYYQVDQKANGRKQSDRHCDLVMPDLAGEALAAEMAEPRTFQVIISLLGISSGLIVLIDAKQAREGNAHQDFFALKLLSYLDDIVGAKRDEQIQKPIAFILSKADECEDAFDDPERFARTNVNRLWNFCNTRLANFQFFATGIVGAMGHVEAEDGTRIAVPLHVEPRNVLGPFRWVFDRLT